jgi:GTP-binding protein
MGDYEAARGATIQQKAPLMRAFFRKPIGFVAGALVVEQLPEFTLPEVAFVGRSNVGKSSLLNALVGQNKLARTSSKPGHTRQINFFNLDDTLMLVDVPGYGYAKAPKTEIARWQQLLFSYLRGRRQLARAFMLVDARHGIKPSDTDMMDMLDEAAMSYQLVLTKCDKATSELATITQRCEAALAQRPAAHPHVLHTAALAGEGIDALQHAILEAAQLSEYMD